MINVNGLKRNAKNIVKKYSDAQILVREATSNDPWGPSSTIMSEIADLTYNVVAFSEIMQMIWKRLNDHGKNWRHVYKALVVLEYLIKTGNEKVAQQCLENIFAIQTLKDFQYIEENKDCGLNIREKSKKLVGLLKDTEKLKSERARALKAKSRIAESFSSGNSGSGSMLSSGSADSTNKVVMNNSYSSSLNDGGSSSGTAHLSDVGSMGLDPTIDSARPQTLAEEENQLRLALALSKEEAEQQEKTRKNEELRLRLALDASKKSAPPTTTTPSNTTSSNLIDEDDIQPSSSTGPTMSTIDDLLGLSTIPKPISTTPLAPPPTKTVAPATTISDDPWSVDPWQTVPSRPTTTAAATATPATLTLDSVTQPINLFNPKKSKNPFED